MVVLTFGIAFLAALVLWLVRGGGIAARLSWPLPVWGLGVGGLFGFHLLYFVALANAPPLEANLVNYLWPLLIVLFSALLPGERLRAGHMIGALLAFSGAALVILGPGAGFSTAYLPGYGAALVCAFAWAAYSVLSRRMGAAPTESVAVFCLATAILATLAHLGLETTVWPAGAGAWAAMLALGAGPVGLAFYLWDVGMKRGDIQLLGILSYAAPLISTFVLIAAGLAEPRAGLVLSAVLIVAGALVAARTGRGDPLRARGR